ncbi:MAG: biotin-independent malonate decarboxylase subunit gamma [Burkholderiales bacterium]
MAFSDCSAIQRIAELLDAGHSASSLSIGSAVLAVGTIGGHAVSIAATNREIAGGSIGVNESRALLDFLAESRAARRPVILCLDSAGAKLSEGLPALGGFRQLYRHFLDLRLAGNPVLALIGRDCFGGASMLASACSRRIYNANSRSAMSGPAVMHALGVDGELGVEAVQSLMGGQTRAGVNKGDAMCIDTLEDYRQAARNWLETWPPQDFPDIRQRHNELGMRLLAHGQTPGAAAEPPRELSSILAEIIPSTLQIRNLDGVFVARPEKTAPGIYLGFLHGNAVGATAAWTMAGECLAFASSHPSDAVTVFLDSPGHSTAVADERVGLSDYIAHLALVLSQLRQRGQRVSLQVAGEAAGGIYVALAAPAQRVVALPGCNVQMLPPAAMARIIGRSGAKADVEDFLRAGVVDTLI